MIAIAHSQNSSTQTAKLALSSSQPCLDLPNASWPSYAWYQATPDAALDEDELDREIHGYGLGDSGDDLDVEVGSDDFEVVGVVYDSEVEDVEDDEESEVLVEGLAQDFGGSADRSDQAEVSDVEEVSEKEEVSDGEEDSDVEDGTETSESRSPSAPLTYPDVTPAHENASNKRKREDSEEEDLSSDEEDQVYQPPPKARRTKRRGDRPIRTRMTVREADSHRQKGAGVTCGIDDCKFLVSEWKAAKTHLDTDHYAAECAAEASAKPTAAKPVAKKRKVRNTSRSGEDKENASAAAGRRVSVVCKYPDCGLTFATIDNAYRHVKTVHWKIGAPVCMRCGKSFARFDSLRRHVESKICNRPGNG
ncbi:hypothetical protein C8Q73DRAFT_416702 [Cubamyces lactineus]|nr:hypothetical protein C8Q73DRAFT_416702 [Cubamyces lactineus]